MDIFAESSYEAPGIDPNFICHHLNVDPTINSKNQHLQKSSDTHLEVVKEEVSKLKKVGAIKEVFYPELLANTVVVKKKTGKCRVCVDFTYLNKAYPKNSFPITKINQLVDASFDHSRMSFLDAFQGYHQITLALAN